MRNRFAEISYDDFFKLMIGVEPGRVLNDTLPPNYANTDALKKPLKDLAEFPFKGPESLAYPHLCSLIKGSFDLAQTENPAVTAGAGLVVHDTAHRREKGSTETEAMTDNDLMPDISIHRKTADKPYELSQSERKRSKVSDLRRPWQGRPSWRHMRLYAEVKAARSPFTLHGLLSESGNVNAKGQISEYSGELRLSQHRRFSYSVVTCREQARLMRWDQAGALVSTSFNYKEDPSKLIRFFYIVGQMTDTQLGLDPTVESASPEETTLWKNSAKLEQDKYICDSIAAATAGNWPLEKVTVNGENLEAAAKRWKDKGNTTSVPEMAPRQLLVGRPYVGHHTPTGRGTKGYVAFDLEDKKFVFLKDCWRVLHKKVEPEMSIYAHLHKNHVPNIPTVLYGGDVYTSSDTRQETHTQTELDGFCGYIHTRLVMKEIGRPLSEYKNSHELVVATRDALKAHQMAWEDAKILHRDISDGNIIITVTNDGKYEGKLIDWENAKRKAELNKGATNSVRSGTWVFLSGLIVFYPGKPIELSDDLESFFHVLVWQALRYHTHSYSGRKLRYLHEFVFNKYLWASEEPEGYMKAQATKMYNMKFGHIGDAKLTEDANSPAFLHLLKSLVKLFQEHYSNVDEDKMARWYEDPTSPLALRNDSEDANVRVLQAYKGPSRLRSHSAMLEVFEEACGKVRISQKDHIGDTDSEPCDWISDKIEDQFKGMPAVTSRLPPSSSASSSKRSSEASEENPSKRRNLGPGGSTNTSLHSVPEDS